MHAHIANLAKDKVRDIGTRNVFANYMPRRECAHIGKVILEISTQVSSTRLHRTGDIPKKKYHHEQKIERQKSQGVMHRQVLANVQESKIPAKKSTPVVPTVRRTMPVPVRFWKQARQHSDTRSEPKTPRCRQRVHFFGRGNVFRRQLSEQRVPLRVGREVQMRTYLFQVPSHSKYAEKHPHIPTLLDRFL